MVIVQSTINIILDIAFILLYKYNVFKEVIFSVFEMKKYNVNIFDGNKIILNKIIIARSLDGACYSEDIIKDLKKVLGTSVLNLTYCSIHQFQASAELWLSNTKTGSNIFRLEAIIVS